MKRTMVCRLVAALSVAAGGGCDGLLDVQNPDVIEAEGIDPLRDQTTFARSALQNFYTSYPALIVFSAWETNEARVGDGFQSRQEFGQRVVTDANGTLNNEVWFPLSRAVASAEDVLELLRNAPDGDKNINIVRAAFASAWALALMGETFCQGVMRVSAPMTTAQVLDSALARFRSVIAVGTANGSADALSMADAARVGMARAYLQQGRKAEAATAAAQVPAGFIFNAPYFDDSSNRGRIGNGVFGYSAGGSRESLVVGPEWRALADAGEKRISYLDTGKNAVDQATRLFTQRKYPAWGAPIRLASKLEADYIAAEAGSTTQQLALIAARRAAAGLPAFTGAAPDAVLGELMRQRALDFWLEGKRMGDVVRNGDAVPYQLPPGSTYYVPQYGQVGDQMCWPVTVWEKDNNPNWK